MVKRTAIGLVLWVSLGWPGGGAPAGPLRPGEIAAGAAALRVDDYLSRLVNHGFSGAVLIAKDGQIVLKRAYGLANRETNLPYAVDMVSCIGSVTKQFTGAAILKLEMMGKLHTADLMSKYLPGVPADKAGITIHQLLTHTAGLSGDLGGADEEPIGRDALVAKVLAAPLASKPGERFEYSNEDYSLAAAIVERVSGQNYETFLREQVFLPAGMKDTGYLAPAWPIERLPVGYRQDGQPWGRTYKNGWLPDGPGWYLRGNGGIQSSLDDLYRWHLALEGTKVLSAEALRKYQTGYVQTQGGDRYGYGWGVSQTRRGTSVIAHNGGNGFLFTDFRRYVDEHVVIIAMSNEPVIPATRLAPRQIESLFFDDGPAVVMPPVPVTVTKSERDRVLGTYTLADGRTIAITPAGDTGIEAGSSDLSIIGSIPGLTPPGGRFADLEKRSVAVLAAGATGDFRPLFEAFNDERPFEVVQGNQRRFWAGWRQAHGEFQKLELLGTAPIQGDPGVLVRLQFERGDEIVQLAWGPRRLAGFIMNVRGGAVPLVAESASSWVLFRYDAATLTRLAFAGDELTLTSGSTPYKGTRRR